MIHALMTGDMTGAAETLLAVSLLILLVLILRRPAARVFGAGIAYLLWVIPVARLLLPPVQTPLSMLSLDGLIPAAAKTPELTFTTTPDLAVQPMTVEFANTPAAVTAGPATPAVIPDASVWSSDLLATGLMVAVSAWAAGAVFMIARNLHAHWRFMQTVEREAMPVSARTEDLALRLAAETGLRRPPRLVASLISRGPFVTGLVRPTIVVPAWFEEDYTRIEARDALAHELMHVRRGDLWALQFSELFVAVLWFNPLAYIARNAFRTDQESACDADVLSRCQTSPHAYGSTLVKAARLHLPEPSLAAASLPLTHALKERLTRMSYPAPSSRRRMIGFGVAVLFGVSTLAITSSVASAGEPESTTHEFRFDDGGIWINGEQVSDRQIVLLGDPMSKVMPIPPMPPEVAELQAQIELDVAEMTGPEMMGPIFEWHESKDGEEFAALAEEMAELHMETIEETVDEVDGHRTVMRVRIPHREMTEAQRDALEAKLEAKAAALEAKMEGREAAIDAHERSIEKKMMVIEKRIEANADKMERIIEARFDGEFEAKIEAQADLLEALIDDCTDATLSKGETRIIERTDAEGEVFRLACVEGDRAQLKSAATLAAVGSHPGITEAEKAAFKAATDGKRRKHVIKFETDGTEIPEPLQPAEPPAPPLKGE